MSNTLGLVSKDKYFRNYGKGNHIFATGSLYVECLYVIFYLVSQKKLQSVLNTICILNPTGEVVQPSG